MLNHNKNSRTSNKKRRRRYSLTIGLSAGVIWGIFFLLAYFFQFSDIGPSVFAKPILNPDYISKWQGQLVGLVFFVIFTVVASFFYMLLLVRFKSPFVGIFYGVLLWAFTFFILSPFFDLTKPVKELGFYTNSVMVSLFILIGLFIGYSIAIEFNNEDIN